jgi:hypothetical protein
MTTVCSSSGSEGTRIRVRVADGGPIRMIDLVLLGAGSIVTGRHAAIESRAAQTPGPVIATAPVSVYETYLYDRLTDMLGLITELSDLVNYTGSWLLGIHVDQVRDRISQGGNGQLFYTGPARYSADDYTASTRATPLQIAQTPHEVAKELLLRLFRGLGTASHLDALHKP